MPKPKKKMQLVWRFWDCAKRSSRFLLYFAVCAAVTCPAIPVMPKTKWKSQFLRLVDWQILIEISCSTLLAFGFLSERRLPDRFSLKYANFAIVKRAFVCIMANGTSHYFILKFPLALLLLLLFSFRFFTFLFSIGYVASLLDG